MKKNLLVLVGILSVVFCNAQCVEGETEVYINVYTDNWGYEAYWELHEDGGECGVDFLYQAGNITEVGCDGAGEEDATAENGYENNIQIVEGPFCLTDGVNYDIIYVDDYSDGGLIVEVVQNDIVTGYFQGAGEGNIWTITGGDSEAVFIDGDRPCEALEITENGETLILSNEEFTIDPNEATPPEGFCGGYGMWCESNNGASNTVWVRFTPETDGAYEVSTCNEGTEFDTALAVYEITDCYDYDSFTLMSSNDDAYIGCDEGSTGYASTCYVSCLTAGQEYYIQIDGWGGATGTAELSVTSHDEGLETDGYDGDADCANMKGENGSYLLPQINGLGINYDVFWSGPNEFMSTERYLTDVPVGNYSYLITNDCGIELEGMLTVGEPEPISSEIIITDASCDGAENGSVEVNVTGGDDPYEYSWTGPDKFASEDGDINDLVSGYYQIQIEDDNGCVAFSNAQVGNEFSLEFTLGDDITICEDEQAEFNAPTGFYLYQWQDESEASSYSVDGSEGEGDYTVVLTISNDEGCEFTDVATVSVDACTSISELKLVNISVFPNPAEDILTVDATSIFHLLVGNYEIEIHDVSGRLVRSLSVAENVSQIDISDLTSGMYSLSIVSEKHSVLIDKVLVK